VFIFIIYLKMHLFYTNTDIGKLALMCVEWGGLSVDTTLVESDMRLDGCKCPKAIVLYLARLAGLLPTHPDDALPVETMLFQVWDEQHLNLHAWQNMGTYVFLDRPTIIDLAVYMMITTRGMKEALNLYPALKDWYTRIHARIA